MTDRNTISQVVESLFEDWIDRNINVHPLAVENMRMLEADALAMLKEQEKPNGKCVNECECWDSAYERGKQDALKEQEDLGTELTNAMELIHKKNERIKKLEEQIETLTRWRANAGAFD